MVIIGEINCLIGKQIKLLMYIYKVVLLQTSLDFYKLNIYFKV